MALEKPSPTAWGRARGSAEGANTRDPKVHAARRTARRNSS
jgi:hypothetical protein